jgi:hypothetical protein
MYRVEKSTRILWQEPLAVDCHHSPAGGIECSIRMSSPREELVELECEEAMRVSSLVSSTYNL